MNETERLRLIEAENALAHANAARMIAGKAYLDAETSAAKAFASFNAADAVAATADAANRESWCLDEHKATRAAAKALRNCPIDAEDYPQIKAAYEAAKTVEATANKNSGKDSDIMRKLATNKAVRDARAVAEAFAIEAVAADKVQKAARAAYEAAISISEDAKRAYEAAKAADKGLLGKLFNLLRG